jgi:acetyltransferase-like isoleucine patch superfamily enzyme
MFRKFIDLYKLHVFQNRWRKANKNNRTYAMTIFPLEKVTVGDNTYGPLSIYSWGQINEKLMIGNYCSIALGVIFLLGGNHTVDTISTYPFKVMRGFKHQEALSKGPIIVEDGVWLGYNAMILSGVTIGKGAIIAAGSIVTKDVPPYTIVGGNPAKVIRLRFPLDVVNTLLKLPSIKYDNISIEKLYHPLKSLSDLNFVLETNGISD